MPLKIHNTPAAQRPRIRAGKAGNVMNNNSKQFSAVTIAMLLGIAAVHAQDETPTKPTKTEKVAYLGITAKSADATLRAQLKLPDDTGLTVQFVDPKGPAKADVHIDDVLQKLDDQILIDPHQLVALIHLHKPGDIVTLTLIREARPMTMTIRLGEKERTVTAPDSQDHAKGMSTPDDLAPLIPFDTHLPLGQHQPVSFTDGTYTASVNPDAEGHRNMVVKDATGKTVAQGPVDTESQWEKFDPDIRKHLDVLHKMLGLKK
jgi:hypothetical protein